MALTRSQLVARVLDTMGRIGIAATRSGVTYETVAIDWINFAQNRIARQYDLLFNTKSANTVASQQCYSLPTEIRTLYSLVLESGSNSRKLIMVHPQRFEEVIPKPDQFTTGLPTWYVPNRAFTEIDLFKIPDSASYTLVMNFSYWPTTLSSASQTSDYERMDDVLIAGAVHEGFLFIQELTDAATWEAIFQKRAREAVDAFDDYPDWYPKGEGFNSLSSHLIVGEYYNDPFIRTDPGGY